MDLQFKSFAAFFIVLAIFSTSACRSIPHQASAPNVSLMGTIWDLDYFFIEGNTYMPPSGEGEYSLFLTVGGSISGTADCNRFSGTFSLQDSTISVGPLAVTRALCVPPSISTEYITALSMLGYQNSGLTGAYEIDADVLIISLLESEDRLVFKARL